MEKRPYAAVKDGVRLSVRVTPRASRSELQGAVTGADGKVSLRIRLTASPHDGEANEALIALLSKELGMRKSDISIHSGHSSRLKIVHLAGDSTAILKRLDAV